MLLLCTTSNTVDRLDDRAHRVLYRPARRNGQHEKARSDVVLVLGYQFDIANPGV